MKEKKIAYTVITGQYEELIPVRPELREGWELICFSDESIPAPTGWEIMQISKEGLIPRALSRKPKILSHIYVPWADISIYFDAHLEVLKPLDEYAAFLETGDFLGVRYKDRNCAYKEMEACVNCKRATKEAMNQQKEEYEKIGFPKSFGLFENQVILRKNSPDILRINEAWWRLMEHFGNWRDQLVLPLVFWKLQYSPKTISWETKAKFFAQRRIHPGIYK